MIREYRCASKHHSHCYGTENEAWQCVGCGGRFCLNEGCEDEYRALCDECWSKQNENRFHQRQAQANSTVIKEQTKWN